MSSTHERLRSRDFSLSLKPACGVSKPIKGRYGEIWVRHRGDIGETYACGVGKPCPSWPSSLLAETTSMLRRGKARCRSDANCSPSQSETWLGLG